MGMWRLLVLGALVVTVASCKEEPATSFAEGLKQCAATDITSDRILYFGPSNSVGPGSGWREAVDSNDKHLDFRLRFVVADLPQPTDFIQPAAGGYSCKDGKSVSFELSVAASGSFTAFPLSAELSNDLKRAKKVTVTVGGMGWDQVKEVAYEQYFKNKLGPGNTYYEDMNGKNRLVLYRALAVKDLAMDYEFSTDDAAKLSAKYNGPLSGGTADIGGNVSANWKNANTMSIVAPGNSWVLGELGKFTSSAGFAGPGSAFAPVPIPAGRVVVDLVKQ